MGITIDQFGTQLKEGMRVILNRPLPGKIVRFSEILAGGNMPRRMIVEIECPLGPGNTCVDYAQAYPSEEKL
jgi:hypothetical protein